MMYLIFYANSCYGHCSMVFQKSHQSIFCWKLTGSHNAHGKDGVVRNLRVTVMGELAECVQDLQLGIGHRDKRQGQWHGATDWELPIAQLMKEIWKCKPFITMMNFYTSCFMTSPADAHTVTAMMWPTRWPNLSKRISLPISFPMGIAHTQLTPMKWLNRRPNLLKETF